MKKHNDSSTLTASELAGELERLLTREEVHAGMRLRSSRDLGLLFKVDKGRVQGAIDALAERGILAKRHGSGTYIRRVPQAIDDFAATVFAPNITITDLLATEDHEQSRRRPLNHHKQLHLQMWIDTHGQRPIMDLILQGAEDVLAPQGHVITRCSSCGASGVPMDRQMALAKMAEEPADGYLVINRLATDFHREFDASGKPWLAFGFESPIRHQPSMILDAMEAAGRATRALLEGGCRRVAMIGFYDHDRDCDFERFHYTHALRHASADAYICAKFVTLDATHVRRALADILSPDLPAQGLYIADDNLLPLVAAELERRGLVPGRDLAVVTLWLEGAVPPGPINWSRMVVYPRNFGQSLARGLLAATQSANARLVNNSTLANWCPGDTHTWKTTTPEAT